MRAFGILALLLGSVAADDPAQTFPLMNVQIRDREGVTTHLAGFHRISGVNRFEGYLGSAEIEVPYARVREIRIRAPETPGGRPRASLTLRTGDVIHAGFDEREGEQLFTGYADFGRVSIYFRDIRRLRVLGRTRRADLPKYGRPAPGVDARIVDREGVSTELIGFRRAGVENTLPGIRGATSIAVPLRIVKRATLEPARGTTRLAGELVLRKGRSVRFRLPVHEEATVYRGEAPFGRLRIRLASIRRLEVHRTTPVLRDLDPVEAARGRARDGDQPRR